MLLRNIYERELAQASYLVGCQATGEALVVDPNRDIAQYIELAQQEGLRITAVTETHIHADFVSGARELAAQIGAKLYLSDAGPAEWKYAFADEVGATLLNGSDHFMVGNVRIDVVHTPGHTPEHLSFLVTDTASANEPIGIFTGDFVFVGDVGRPDLLEKAAGVAGSTEQAAQDLFQSLRRFTALPDYLQIWPGHGAGSACGKALGAVPQSTVGYEQRTSWAFGITDEDQFVEAVLSGQPAPPTYFAQMKRINKEGPSIVGTHVSVERLAPEDLAAELVNDTVVIDTRPAADYAMGHVPGTLNLPLGSGFLTWAGWLVPYDRPFALIVDEAEAPRAAQKLRLIGLDDLKGFWTPEAFEAWTATGQALATIRQVDPAAARELVEWGEVAVIDVRNPSERVAGRIGQSRNIPLGELQRRLQELPTDRPVLMHCQGGLRSAIASSILSGHRPGAVINLQGGFGHWQAAGNPVERGDETAVEPATREELEVEAAYA